jgi:hypothetical protein
MKCEKRAHFDEKMFVFKLKTLVFASNLMIFEVDNVVPVSPLICDMRF